MPNLPGSPTGQPDNPPTANHIALPVGFALHEYTVEAMLGACLLYTSDAADE